MTQTPPRWDLSPIYASLEDPSFTEDMRAIGTDTEQTAAFFERELLPLAEQPAPAETLSARLGQLVEALNALMLKASRLGTFLNGLTTTDSYDKAAEKLQSQFYIALLPFSNFMVKAQAWLGKVAVQLPEALKVPGPAREHAFFLLENAEQSRYLMSEKEEVLANMLTLSGGTAWGDLQGTLTSQKTVAFELDGESKALPMPALINLRSHPDADVRERAYKLEQQVWEEMKEPLAACLNGVKGETNTLNKLRGREDCLHQSLDQARIDRTTLEAMISAIQDALPMFRDYFRAKAKILGQEKLPWWSLFAPIGKVEKTYTFDEAKALVLTHFGSFTPELAAFARRAFEENWIDAEQRPGKRGGAYCMGIDAIKQSRVMCNFDGSLDQVMTIAHELGHGFHNYCAYQVDKTPLQSETPMTLAETASIMCETIVFNAILKTVTNPEEERAILETSISSDAQVTVDILSRFLFEKEVFARRDKGTLSADEISEVMLQAQRDSYGDGLDEEVLNKFAWTWKPHYYSPGLAFYNFPYAFGMLFAKGLYAIYRERGEAFVNDYKALLASTGEGTAAELAARFGIDIRSKAFWKSSLDEIGERIQRYISL